MPGITFAVPERIKDKMKRLSWVNWSVLIRREILKHELLKKFKSKEEQELIKWSVNFGRRAKKGRFKQLLKEVSPEIRERLLSKLSPEKREEYK
jgi:hypothetical protein